MAINLFSSKDSEEICTMHGKIDNIEILIGNETNEVIEDFFDSLLERYQKGLEESMKGLQTVDVLNHVPAFSLQEHYMYQTTCQLSTN